LILFGGNFTDVAIAKSMDRLCMAIHELGSLSDVNDIFFPFFLNDFLREEFAV